MNNQVKNLVDAIAAFEGQGNLEVASALPQIQPAIRRLNAKVALASRIRNHDLEIKADGTVIVGAPSEEPRLNILPDGTIEVFAGERLATLIERARLAKGLTCEDVVEKLSIRKEMYKRIESGYVRRPPDDILEEIATAVGADFDTLKKAANLDSEYPVDGYSY